MSEHEDRFAPEEAAEAAADHAAADHAATGQAAAEDAAAAEAAADDAAAAEAAADDMAPDDEPLAEAEARIEADLEQVLAERDEYLDALRRLQADFANFRKRVMKQEAEQLARAAEGLVGQLLPVLDACDAALAHGADDVRPIADALFGALEKEGLERLAPEGKPFDPAEQEAVVHEPGEGGDDQVVIGVLRAGYRWKGRVLRPAMVKVRG